MQYDEHKLVEYFADAPAGVGFSDLDLNNIPHHISCIMDGNGRWATSRGLARTEGHKAGILSLREIITACVRLGVDVLSAYAFSTENWNRPQHEVNVLMHLFAKTFIDELPLLKRENVRVVFLGDISALPKHIFDEMMHFFEVYKQLEGKKTTIDKMMGRKEAEEIIQETIDNYKKEFENKEG